MASGHLIFVSHARNPEPPLLVTYAVAIADENEAARYLQDALGLTGQDDLQSTQAISADDFKHLNLSPGQYRSIWPTLELPHLFGAAKVVDDRD